MAEICGRPKAPVTPMNSPVPDRIVRGQPRIEGGSGSARNVNQSARFPPWPSRAAGRHRNLRSRSLNSRASRRARSSCAGGAAVAAVAARPRLAQQSKRAPPQKNRAAFAAVRARQTASAAGTANSHASWKWGTASIVTLRLKHRHRLYLRAKWMQREERVAGAAR